MARVLRQVTVARDGWHNAFTDLQFWQGCYWVGYRKGTAHVSMDGEAVIAVSTDRARFREVAHLHVPGDDRDPKLLPISEDRMACYWPSWVQGTGRRIIQHYITFSGNGYDWEEPKAILDRNLWLWRIRPHEGRYYGLVQNLQGWLDDPSVAKPHQLDLAVSDDLLTWKTICRIGGDGPGLNESDIYWREDGEAWLVARSVNRTESFFCCAKPPYTEWDVTPLDAMIHAPVFVEHEGALYVAGRSNPAFEGVDTWGCPGASLALWRVERGKVVPVLRIPATGDCSYPGLIKDPDGRICMSYYSQHAYHLGVEPFPAKLNAEGGMEILAADDVYFAELELP